MTLPVLTSCSHGELPVCRRHAVASCNSPEIVQSDFRVLDVLPSRASSQMEYVWCSARKNSPCVNTAWRGCQLSLPEKPRAFCAPRTVQKRRCTSSDNLNQDSERHLLYQHGRKRNGGTPNLADRADDRFARKLHRHKTATWREQEKDKGKRNSTRK